MDSKEASKKAQEVKERMNAERVMKITKELHEHGLLPPRQIDSIEDDMFSWNNEQLEAMERFISMALDHAKEVITEFAEKIAEYTGGDSESEVSMAISELDQSKEYAIKRSKETEDAMTTDEATKLAHMMTKVGLIGDSSFEEQVEEIKTWGPEALRSMWEMVEKATKPSTEPKVEARKWGAGSEIAKAHHEHVEGVLKEAYKRDEKEVVIDEPNHRKSIKEAIQEAETKKSESTRVISKRGSIKERKEESDRKTVEEPEFVSELRKAREFLEKFDETFACAKVSALKAKEAMLHEEQRYDGTKIHSDTDDLRTLTKEHMKAQRDFAIIDKVYKQAFSRFEKVDVEQASVEELEEALRNYQAGDEHTDIDALFGGKYKTGDDPYYKWLARKKKFISAEEAAELFTDMVNSFPSEVAGAFKKDKRSVGAVTPHTQGEASPETH